LALENDPDSLRATAAQSTHPPGTGSLGNKTEVLLLIDEDIKRFFVGDKTRWLLGRFEDTDHADQFNLAPYGAFEKGVSRFHLQLHVEDQQLFATDLNSTNGTYLGGEPLLPSKPVIVRNGDVLMLARLSIQILFR
jgi:FHA domain